MGTRRSPHRAGGRAVSPVVALLFTDLVGSTALLDRLGDDRAEKLRRVHFSLLRAAVAEFGGEEVKSLGDGLMVSFASPVQAVGCAVAMQRAVAAHNQDRADQALGVRIGLHAGEPVQEEDDFFGTAVVVAKRLCDRAEGGQILASDLLAGLVGSRGGFRFAPIGRLTLKGFAEPFPAMAVEWKEAPGQPAARRRRAPERRRRPAPRGPALVGRDRELAVLEAELARAAAGEFRVVMVVADPGVGKTRLAGELLARHQAEVIGLAARAHPLGETTSFGLWAEALEGYLRGLERGEVADVCGGFVDDLSALLRSAAAVRGSAPAGEPPRARLVEGLAVLVANLAEDRPVIVFLDDVHVADASSWDALHYLARNLSAVPVLVVAAARPAELAGQLGPTQVLLGLEQDGLLRRLELGPLASEAVAELASAVLGAVAPPSLVAWLDERCRGNPLFTLGLLTALLEEGADLAAPRLRRLPEGLAERVSARLATLDEPARATLEVLAVLGRRVELGQVVALTARPLDLVGPLLDGLVRARLVSEDERSAEVTYEIAHPLIQEAIYQSLGSARRHALHRLIGRALLAAGRLGEAAPHFGRSAHVGDPEAIEALSGAVRQAEERHAYREALTILGALVELIPAGDERWLAVLDALALDAEWVVDHRADVHANLAIPALRTIDALLEGSSDLRRRARVKFRLASFLTWGTGEFGEAERLLRQALELYESAGDQPGMLLARLEQAYTRGFAGDMSLWVPAGRRVAEAAEAAGERFVLMQALGRGVGWGTWWNGQFEEAEDAFRRAAALAGEDGRVYFQSLSLAGLAFTLALEGRIEEARPLLDEARIVNPDWRESLMLEWELMVLWLAGEFEAALAQGRESLAWNAGGMGRRRAFPLAFAALAGVETGRPAEAERFLAVARAVWGDRPEQFRRYAQAVLDQAVTGSGSAPALRASASAIRAIGTPAWLTFVLVDLAEVAASGRDVETASWAAAELDEMAKCMDRDLYRALAAMGTAWLALGSKAPDEAAEAAEAAVALLPPGYRCFSGRALDLLGRTLAAHDRPRAREAFERAATVFDACGASARRDRSLDALRRMGGPGSGKQAAARFGPGQLSAREREVARLAAQRRTAPEIARQLFIGERTVESHLARIYAKLGIASKLDLAERGAELGLADPEPPEST